MIALTVALAVVVGISLGLLGGGGFILTGPGKDRVNGEPSGNSTSRSSGESQRPIKLVRTVEEQASPR